MDLSAIVGLLIFLLTMSGHPFGPQSEFLDPVEHAIDLFFTEPPRAVSTHMCHQAVPEVGNCTQQVRCLVGH